MAENMFFRLRQFDKSDLMWEWHEDGSNWDLTRLRVFLLRVRWRLLTWKYFFCSSNFIVSICFLYIFDVIKIIYFSFHFRNKIWKKLLLVIKYCVSKSYIHVWNTLDLEINDNNNRKIFFILIIIIIFYLPLLKGLSVL